MIGEAMLYTMLAGAPIALAAMAGAHYLRRHGRAERWVWLLGLVLAFAVPLAMLWSSPPGMSVPDEATTALEAPAAATTAASTAAAIDAAPAAAIDLDSWLLVLWLVVSLVLAVRWVLSALRLRGIGREWIHARLDGARVVLTPELGPAVAGTLRPRILVPSWVAALPVAERRLVLLHELEHIRAGDHLAVALGRMARVVVPWNPAVWILASGLGRALELDCDRRVLRRRPDVAAYGATLLMISERASTRTGAAAAFAESDVPLRRRILSMTTPPRRLRVAGALCAIALVCALLVGSTRVPVPDVPSPWEIALALRDAVALQQGSSDELPPLRITSDPGRQWVIFVLESGLLERRVFVPANRWFPTSADGRSGFVPKPSFPRPAFPQADWAVVFPPPSDVESLQLVQVPEILNAQEIHRAADRAYPPELRERGIGGTVGVQFLVEPAGVVHQRRVAQGSAYPNLDQAALEVARVYRFSGGATEDGAVAVWVSHAIDFRVE